MLIHSAPHSKWLTDHRDVSLKDVATAVQFR